jgi:hypothetical protein
MNPMSDTTTTEVPAVADPLGLGRTAEQLALDTTFLEDMRAVLTRRFTTTKGMPSQPGKHEYSGMPQSQYKSIGSWSENHKGSRAGVIPNALDASSSLSALRKGRVNGEFMVLGNNGHSENTTVLSLEHEKLVSLPTRLTETIMPGTILKFAKKALAPEISPLADKAMAEKYFEYLQAASDPRRSGFTYDPVSTRCLDLYPEAPAVLKFLREQLALLNDWTVVTIAPVWLRYVSDGSMSSQQEGKYGVRSAPFEPVNGCRPLLYDKPAWSVALKHEQEVFRTGVYVNADGDFICSYNCQREVTKDGGIDLYTGKALHHTLLTWVAGSANDLVKGKEAPKKLSNAATMTDFLEGRDDVKVELLSMLKTYGMKMCSQNPPFGSFKMTKKEGAVGVLMSPVHIDVMMVGKLGLRMRVDYQYGKPVITTSQRNGKGNPEGIAIYDPCPLTAEERAYIRGLFDGGVIQ